MVPAVPAGEAGQLWAEDQAVRPIGLGARITYLARPPRELR